MPNLPPGVASALMHHPQYMGLPAAYFGIQQPAMYGAYGNTGLEDLAAIQRATASATGMHTLVGSAAAAAAAAQQPASTALQSAIKVVCKQKRDTTSVLERMVYIFQFACIFQPYLLDC